MAISNLGTVNALPAEQLPSGYTKPVITAFNDWQYVRTVTLSVLKATVETATPSATMTAILNNATIGINKQVADIIAASYIATQTVTSYAVLNKLTTNVEVADFKDQTYLNNTAVSYKCTVKIYVKAL